eukprot:TRINITY_DN110198_c0_g1_i1.p1 TRINITY_DN110198_c0_g1~~TRINITY_DN110198_c0_g1_i1.p1  ORF type:complete len:203 (-),score=44.71 TRINITY_DN110198_c0_g1_i1:40-648(-)
MAPKRRSTPQPDPNAGRGKRQRTSTGSAQASQAQEAAAPSRGGRSQASASVRNRRGTSAASRGGAEASELQEEGGGGDVAAATAGRHIARFSEVEDELRDANSDIGGGTKATVLFHEPCFDSAMISLEAGGSEMAESNDTTLEMLYCVVEAEAGQVEFELPDTNFKQHLSLGGEVLVPAGSSYILRNLSTTTRARLLAVVPR